MSQAYRRAAVGLDERAPPTSARAAPLRRRLREFYATCMCNAAVAGFKAAAAAPAPGEAHSLVVEACSRALERSGGKCPKVRPRSGGGGGKGSNAHFLYCSCFGVPYHIARHGVGMGVSGHEHPI